MANEELVKTGEIYVRDEEGNLFLSKSFTNSKGVVTTIAKIIEEVDNG